MKATTFVFALFALPVALAKIGGSCKYKGLQGTCQKVSSCTSGEYDIG